MTSLVERPRRGPGLSRTRRAARRRSIVAASRCWRSTTGRPAAGRGRPRRRPRARAATARRRFRTARNCCRPCWKPTTTTAIGWRFAASHCRPSQYIVVVGADLEPMDEELEFLRGILAYIVPIALGIAGVGGWFLARQSLSPVVAMADRARRIGVENLSERLPVANPRDELGHLAETFNELLGRLEASLDPAAAVHGRRVARAADAGGDDAHRGRASRCSSRIATSTSIARRSRSSSSRRRGCRASSTTCSRSRAPTPATIRCA